MTAEERAGFGEELRDKLREIGWFALLGILRWLIEYVTRGNPAGGDKDAERERE